MPSQGIPLSRPPRFAILGCYGDANTGDEALLAGTLALVRRNWPAAHIHVFSNTPQATAEEYGVASSSSLGMLKLRHFVGLARRGELQKTWRALRTCDCLIVGGGELLRTDYGPWAVLSIFDRILLARFLACPILFLGVGVGRLDPGRTLRILRRGTYGSTVLTRDEESARALRQIGVAADAVPDVALQAPAEYKAVPLPEGKRVSFSLLAPDTRPGRKLSWLPRETFVRQMAALADQVVQWGATPVFVPFSYAPEDDDRAIHRDVVRAMQDASRAHVVEKELSASKIKGLLADMDIVVGMRLHACVFGIGEQRPVLALSYDAKVRKVMSHFGLEEQVVPLEKLETAPAQLEALWRRRQDSQAHLSGRLQAELQHLETRFQKVFAVSQP